MTELIVNDKELLYCEYHSSKINHRPLLTNSALSYLKLCFTRLRGPI